MNAPAKSLPASEAVNLTALRLDVQRAVAIAKVVEFENQAYRLRHAVAAALITRSAAADLLLQVAESNGLVRIQGDQVVQSIIARALNEAAA